MVILGFVKKFADYYVFFSNVGKSILLVDCLNCQKRGFFPIAMGVGSATMER
jgi:hypothetical protein